MKNAILVLLVFQLGILNNCLTQEKIDVEISYIGNEGFMINSKDKKIFIDALYYSGNGSIMDVEESVRNMIMDNIAPFSNSQLFLVTHSHPDHYDKDMVATYLVNHIQSKLVASSEIIAELSNGNLNEQLITANPAKYEAIDTTINGVELTVYYFLHNTAGRVYNLGYFATIGGLNIFHGGDNTLEDTTEFATYKIKEKKIDVLFLWNKTNSLWGTQQQRDLIKKYINPKYIILMHIPIAQIALVKQQVKELNDNTFPPIIVFAASMEKVKINDTLIMSNHMPEKVATIVDIAIAINTPITINVANIFNDPDINDLLTYSISGLPDGLLFNSTKMTITGNVKEAGSYTVDITVKDTSFCSNHTSFKIIANSTTHKTDKYRNESNIYPNPATDIVFINNIDFSQAVVQIYNLNGKLVFNSFSIDNKLDISFLSKGIYIIKLAYLDNVRMFKLIKE